MERSPSVPLEVKVRKPGWLLLMFALIQDLYWDTRVYTPGKPGLAQPCPKLTTPAWIQRLFCFTTKGPPESPFNEYKTKHLYKIQNMGRIACVKNDHLTGIFASAAQPGTDHVISYASHAIVTVTLPVPPNGHLHLHQVFGWWKRN